MVHCNVIADYAVIGMGAVICYDVEIGTWCIIGEGSVVPNGQHIPPGKMVIGVPAKIVGDVQQKHKDFWIYGKQLYVDLAKKYRREFKRIDTGEQDDR